MYVDCAMRMVRSSGLVCCQNWLANGLPIAVTWQNQLGKDRKLVEFTWHKLLTTTFWPRRLSSAVRLKSYREEWLIGTVVGDVNCCTYKPRTPLCSSSA